MARSVRTCVNWQGRFTLVCPLAVAAIAIQGLTQHVINELELN